MIVAISMLLGLRMQSGGPTQYFPILCTKFVFDFNCVNCDQDSSSGCHMLVFWVINLIVLYSLSDYVHCCIIGAVREASINKNCLPASQFVHINCVIFALSDSAGVVLLIHHCLMHRLFMCIFGKFRFKVVKDKVPRSMFWILGKEATGGWRKLCIDEFHNYCYSAIILDDQIKKAVIGRMWSTRFECVKYVQNFSEKTRREESLRERVVGWRTTLELIVQWLSGLDSSGSGVICCESDNEPRYSINSSLKKL